jgi:hypothetical protein
VERREIELGFQGKVIELGPHFQPLQFDKAPEGGKEMIGLGSDSLRGQLRQRHSLCERLVITLHLPPFVIGRGQVVKRQGGITGDQITNAHAAVFICEDLLDEPQREIDSFEIDELGGVRFQFQCIHSGIQALVFVSHTQGDFAVGLEGTDRIMFLLLFEEDPVCRRGEPHVEEHKPKGNEMGHRLLDQLPTHLILGHRTAPFFFLCLGIHILLGLGHHVKAHGQTHPVVSIQRRQEVAPFGSRSFEWS